jgi:hypothetical protein
VGEEKMTLEEQLKVIPKKAKIYLSGGEDEYLGCKDSFLLGNILLDKEVKTVKLCSFVNNDEVEVVLQIELTK